MRRLLKILLWTVLAVLGLVVAMVAALFIGLNTGAGRNFAVAQINHFLANTVQVAGLGGHFPEDIKIAHFKVLDAKGAYVTGDNLELRWLPQALLSRTVHVTALTATDLTVIRAPAPSQSKSKKSSASLPNIHLAVDHLAIPALNIGAALAGQPLTLAVSGNAHAQSITRAGADITAIAAHGKGIYRLQAAINDQVANLALHVAEPPDGLLGHFAGPQVNAPLHLDIALNGPRDQSALQFAAALGDAKLNGAGTLDLNPDAPQADVVLNVPQLAPVAAIAKQTIGGSTTLHLVIGQQHGIASVALNGDVALTQAPGPAVKLVGPNGHLALLVTLANNLVTIKNLQITGAGFAAAVTGTAAKSGIALTTQLSLNNVAALSPAISGPVSETGTVSGTLQDFALHAVVNGDIAQKSVPTGPFTLTIDAQHLPKTPTGTLTASGQLEGAPLSLDAAFARDAAGAVSLKIDSAAWRSLSAQADLALAQGAKLPTGTAKFAVTRLADFRPFAPLPLAGSIQGDFAHQDASDFVLNLTAANLLVSPSLGAINAKVNASGPTNALAVKLTAAIAKLMDDPAHLAAAATVNIDNRSLTLSALNASWHSLNAILQGSAGIETKPDIAVRHLALALNGAAITVDGTASPHLNLHVAVNHLPAKLAAIFAPSINPSGTLSLTADVTGTPKNPAGKLTLDADRIALHTGPAAALPPATLTASATLANRTANLVARLGVGPNLTLDVNGLVPLSATGPIALHLTGITDLRLLDPILAVGGTSLRGTITPDLTVTGTPKAPRANGTVTLAGGSLQNIGSGLSLTAISAHIAAADRLITLQSLSATAGPGRFTGHGSIDLGQPNIPIDLVIDADNARPISSDLVTENLDMALAIKGAVRGALALGGKVTILSANINIPKSLPPSVVNLPILNRGQKPPPPAPPPPNIALNLLVSAANQIFIRGDGLFAELGGSLKITGTAAHPNPEGGFTLIRGSFALGGRTLQFTKGIVSFNGAGFMPTLDLEATSTSGSVTSTLTIGGTAAKPTITLSSTPPLPSDEVLARILFGQGTSSLSAFQAAQLAAALAQLSGIGGGADPLNSVRNALGLDELSLGGSGGAPTVQAGRYVAPGVYVGAQQSTSGQGTQATVQINLYKGLKLNTSTGTSTSGSGGNASSVGLTYQFNY